MIASESHSFSDVQPTSQADVDPTGLPRYLTSIIASPLGWVQDDEDKELIWNLASRRLSEKSGRTAMGDMTRTFQVPSGTGSITISIHEPALTEDNLGFKTWVSSYILAKQLYELKPPAPTVPEDDMMVLELGAGTGLVGIAAAALWNVPVIMTDLPEIEPNLAKNVTLNSLRRLAGGSASLKSGVLDWTSPQKLHVRERHGAALQKVPSGTKATTILAADSLYSVLHPKVLAQTIKFWLSQNASARVMLANPQRAAYAQQRDELFCLLCELGLEVMAQGTEIGRDDWAEEVSVSWQVWRWRRH